MSKIILVTGGEGFLGKALVTKLRQEGYETIALSSKTCDLSQPRSVEELLSIQSDFVFHLAGKTGISASWENPLKFYQANFDTTRHVLEYCRLRKTPMHYVSGYIYGNQGAISIAETTPARPNNPYAHSKWMGEEMCLAYAHLFSLLITISRPFNIYGPGQSPAFFIPKMIEQLQNQKEIQPLSLYAKRDYVFIDDVVDALIAIMKKGSSFSCYNVGSGQSFSCLEVIEELQKLMNVQKPIVVETSSSTEEVPYTQADIRKIQSEIGWNPTHTLQKGLRKCLMPQL